MPGYYYYEKKNKELKIALTIVLTINILFLVYSFGNIYTTYTITAAKNNDVLDEVPIITITPELKTKLNHAYELSSVELIYCLYGDYNRTGNLINITTLKIPYVHEATSYSVDYNGCDIKKDYLGSLHIHPEYDCKLSKVDIFWFGYDYHRSHKLSHVKGVHCGNDSFVFYKYDELNTPMYAE